MRLPRLLFFLTLLLPSFVHGAPLVKALDAPTLAGSKETERSQNIRVDESGIVRVVDDEHLKQLVVFKLLIPLPHAVCVDYKLERQWRWAVPWAVYFLSDLGSEFQDMFGHCLRVSSVVRTILRQLEIIFIERNRNAAPAFGERRSLHFTGATVDITKLGLSKTEIKWLRSKLLDLEKKALVNATEEFGQAVFHVMVWPEYASKD